MVKVGEVKRDFKVLREFISHENVQGIVRRTPYGVLIAVCMKRA